MLGILENVFLLVYSVLTLIFNVLYALQFVIRYTFTNWRTAIFILALMTTGIAFTQNAPQMYTSAGTIVEQSTVLIRNAQTVYYGLRNCFKPYMYVWDTTMGLLFHFIAEASAALGIPVFGYAARLEPADFCEVSHFITNLAIDFLQFIRAGLEVFVELAAEAVDDPGDTVQNVLTFFQILARMIGQYILNILDIRQCMDKNIVQCFVYTTLADVCLTSYDDTPPEPWLALLKCMLNTFDILNGIGGVFGPAIDFITSKYNYIKDNAEPAVRTALNTLNSLIGELKGYLSSLKKAYDDVKSFFESIKDGFCDVFGCRVEMDMVSRSFIVTRRDTGELYQTIPFTDELNVIVDRIQLFELNNEQKAQVQVHPPVEPIKGYHGLWYGSRDHNLLVPPENPVEYTRAVKLSKQMRSMERVIEIKLPEVHSGLVRTLAIAGRLWAQAIREKRTINHHQWRELLAEHGATVKPFIQERLERTPLPLCGMTMINRQMSPHIHSPHDTRFVVIAVVAITAGGGFVFGVISGASFFVLLATPVLLFGVFAVALPLVPNVVRWSLSFTYNVLGFGPLQMDYLSPILYTISPYFTNYFVRGFIDFNPEEFATDMGNLLIQLAQYMFFEATVHRIGVPLPKYNNVTGFPDYSSTFYGLDYAGEIFSCVPDTICAYPNDGPGINTGCFCGFKASFRAPCWNGTHAIGRTRCFPYLLPEEDDNYIYAEANLELNCAPFDFVTSEIQFSTATFWTNYKNSWHNLATLFKILMQRITFGINLPVYAWLLVIVGILIPGQQALGRKIFYVYVYLSLVNMVTDSFIMDWLMYVANIIAWFGFPYFQQAFDPAYEPGLYEIHCCLVYFPSAIPAFLSLLVFYLLLSYTFTALMRIIWYSLAIIGNFIEFSAFAIESGVYSSWEVSGSDRLRLPIW